jgi:cytochrome P450
MLAETRVHTTTFAISVVCRYQDCVDVLGDPRWSVDSGRVDPVRMLFGASAPETCPVSKLDPPEHTVKRRLMAPSFTPRAVNAIDDVLRSITADALETLPANGRIDLVSAFAVPLSIRTVGRLFGVSQEDAETIACLSRDVSYKMELADLRPRSERSSQLGDATASLRALLAADRSRRGGLLDSIADAEWNGHRLSRADIAANSALFAMAVVVPTVSLVAGAALALLSHPTSSGPHIDDQCVEELLRLTSPIQMRPRVATTELSIGDHVFRPGDQVIALIAAANRDPRVFIDPDRYDPSRSGQPNLAFGYGRHMCLGAHFARRQALVALDALFRAFPKLAIAPLERAVEYEPAFAIRRPRRIEVDLAGS